MADCTLQKTGASACQKVWAVSVSEAQRQNTSCGSRALPHISQKRRVPQPMGRACLRAGRLALNQRGTVEG